MPKKIAYLEINNRTGKVSAKAYNGDVIKSIFPISPKTIQTIKYLCKRLNNCTDHVTFVIIKRLEDIKKDYLIPDNFIPQTEQIKTEVKVVN